MKLRLKVTTAIENHKRGANSRASPFQKSLGMFLGDCAERAHCVVVTTSRQQPDKEVGTERRFSSPPTVVAGCTVDNAISFVSVYFTGVPVLCDEVLR